MIDQKDTAAKENTKDGSGKADLRVVRDRVSESFSTVLKKTREKKGLSLREAAELLHMSGSTLSAIEEQRYDKLPADIYTTGYIRAYAALLELNPEGLVKDFKQSKELLELNARDRLIREQQAQLEALKYKEPAFDKWIHSLRENYFQFSQKYFKQMLALLIISLFGLIFFVQHTNQDSVESFKRIDKVKVLSADGSVHVSDLTAFEKATPVIANGENAKTGENKIKMMFSDTTWVTVRDGQQNLIHQSRQQKGEVLEVSGQTPFYVKLSKASAANLYFNGQIVDFSAEVSDDDQLHEFIVAP